MKITVHGLGDNEVQAPTTYEVLPGDTLVIHASLELNLKDGRSYSVRRPIKIEFPSRWWWPLPRTVKVKAEFTPDVSVPTWAGKEGKA